MAASSIYRGDQIPTSTECCLLIFKAWRNCKCTLRRLCPSHLEELGQTGQDQPIEAQLMMRLVSDDHAHYEIYTGSYEDRDKCKDCQDLTIMHLTGSKEEPGFHGHVLDYDSSEEGQASCSLHANKCPTCGTQEAVISLCEEHPTRAGLDAACRVISRQDPHNPLRWARKMSEEMVTHTTVVKTTEWCQACAAA